MNVIIYGIGRRFFDNKDKLLEENNIVAIVDSDPNKQDTYKQFNVISPFEINIY